MKYTNALEMAVSKTTTNVNTMAADKTPKTPVKRTAKAEATVPVVPAVAAPVVVAPAVSAPVAHVSADSILSTLQASLKALSSDVTSRVRELVAAATDAAKALKREARDSKRRVKVDPATLSPEARAVWEARRANNAFLKLRPISDELSAFMGLPAKSQRSQTDVTKYVSTYVKEHSCFDPSFKRRIIPDAKLGKLLRAKDGQEVTYLNLQSFLKVHFLKPAVPATA